jgi:hypothetical protein
MREENPSGFDEFCNFYPRKVNKKEAITALWGESYDMWQNILDTQVNGSYAADK